MNRIAVYTFILIVSAGLFIHSLGKAHLFDWDEINFAESAREMIETGNYMQVQINYEPFWEKPPVFFWMQVAAMKMFGVNEFAARLPNAICGIVTLLVLFGIGRRLHDERFAFWWVLVYAGTFLPHLYFKSGIIDPWFNLFIFLGIYYLSSFLSARENRNKTIRLILLSALFTGLAVLTKGPVALLIILLCYGLYLLINRGKGLVPIKYYLLWTGGVLLVTLLWFGLEIAQHGWWFLNEFITYQIRLFQTKDAGHGGFLLYHFVVLLLGCFPASVLIFRYRNLVHETNTQQNFRKMMIVSLAIILIVFTIVKTKIVHYSSFAYFPIGYLAATAVYGIVNKTALIKNWQKIFLLAIGVILSLLFIALPLIGKNIHWLKPLLQKDLFAQGNIEAVVNWSYIHIIPGVLFLITTVLTFIWLHQKRFRRAMLVLFISGIGAMQVLLTWFAPRIEQYSQNAAIEFFETLQGKDVYIKTLGYKSYAQHFYTKVKPGNRKESKDENWLLTGAVDKPTYFVSKNTFSDTIMKYHGERLTILYKKNGFVFYQRK